MLQIYQKLGLIRKIKQDEDRKDEDLLHSLEYTYQDVFHYTSGMETYGKTEEEAYDAAVSVLRETFPTFVEELVDFVADGTCTDVRFDLSPDDNRASLMFICHQFMANIDINLSHSEPENIHLYTQSKSENIQLYKAALDTIDAIKRYRAGEKIVLPDIINASFAKITVKTENLTHYKSLYTTYRYLGIIEDDLPRPTATQYTINYVIPDEINRLISTWIEGVTNISFDFALPNIVDTISRSIPDEWRQLAEKIVEMNMNWGGLSILPHKHFNIQVKYRQNDIIYVKKLRGDFLGSFSDRHYLYRSLLRDIIISFKINQLVSQFVKNKLMISPRMVIYDSVIDITVKFTYKLSSLQYKDVLSYTDRFGIMSPSSWQTTVYNKFLRKMKARVPYRELSKVKINFKDDDDDIPQYPDAMIFQPSSSSS